MEEENERLPPPIPGEEASIGSGQKITVQGQGQRGGATKGVECDMGGGGRG